MPFVVRFEHAIGGGGHECRLSLVSSRQVVVVGVNGFPIGSFKQGSGGGGGR